MYKILLLYVVFLTGGIMAGQPASPIDPIETPPPIIQEESVPTKPILIKKESVPYHPGYGESDLAQKLIRYAWDRADDLGIPQDLSTYGVVNMLKTFDLEAAWQWDIQSRCHHIPGNSCAKSGGWREESFGICQLNIKGNDTKSLFVFGKPYNKVTKQDMETKNFSEAFKDPYQQMNYCMDMRAYASKVGSMPWSKFHVKQKSMIVMRNVN